MILRDYQERMISDIHSAYRHGYKRPCAVMPCGAGKSLTAAEIAACDGIIVAADKNVATKDDAVIWFAYIFDKVVPAAE